MKEPWVNQKTCPSRAGISVFAGHVYDAVTECPCSVAALIHMSLRVAVTLLNPAGDAARVKRLNAQSSENDVALFLTNHSLSFACSPSTFQILQISRVSERSLSCCRIGCSVFHARSCCPFSTLFPGKSMLFPPSSACFWFATNPWKWRKIEVRTNWLIMNRIWNDLHKTALFVKGRKVRI